ncbi:MAG: NAD+ synthase [Bacteroidales bacterium]|jgi:NAD+ synthase (glutamine-hydrolysing)
MKITVAQLNYHIGNFEGNKNLILKAIGKAKNDGSDLVIFSELCIPGYPPLDLLHRADFIEKCNRTVNEIANHCNGIAAIAGSPVINKNPHGKKLFNSALFLSEGKVLFSTNKTLLPTYDVFDEYRYFEPETEFKTFRYKDLNIALTICEDLWDELPSDNEFGEKRLYGISPMEELIKNKPDIIINIAASPFSYKKFIARENIFRNKANKYQLPVIFVNQTGANTELIFDGASMAINPEGKPVRQMPFFEEAVETFSIDELISKPADTEVQCADPVALIHKALVTGIRDYFRKMNFKTAVLGLSGGIDSAVALCLVAEALGSENTTALLLPSRYSSGHSISDSVKLARTLGVRYEIISIEKTFTVLEDALSQLFAGKESDVTEENIQARIRATILMAFANKFGSILINASNKSEAAVGYGTLYGDMAGGLSVLGDVYKTDVYLLARHINKEMEIIPESIISKPPSAELKFNQLDTDSLPEYSILDPILYQYIELQKPADSIDHQGAGRHTVDRIIKMINSTEYKRYQAPPVLRISSKAFGNGRKMPLVALY